MKMFKACARGFTVVELTVVIAVVGILATIGLVAYQSYIQDTHVATMKKDMQLMNLAIQKYYSKHGRYPAGSEGYTSWSWRRAHGENFIAGLVPEYISTMPDVQHGNTSNGWYNTYMYLSNAEGTDYKLVRVAEQDKTLPQHELDSIDGELKDPNTSRTDASWGYWSRGASSW